MLAFLLLQGSQPSMPGPPPLPALPSNLGFAETITIWLTILSVMIGLATVVLAGVGVFVGVLAVFGYGTFKDEVRTRAGQAARTAAEEYFNGKAFDDKLKESIQAPMWESGTVSGGSIARNYPKKEEGEQ
jgi:hypothetical protein